MPHVQVKPTTVNGRSGYGIKALRGKWFFYAYETQEQADSVASTIEAKWGDSDKNEIASNFSHNAPGTIAKPNVKE